MTGVLSALLRIASVESGHRNICGHQRPNDGGSRTTIHAATIRDKCAVERGVRGRLAALETGKTFTIESIGLCVIPARLGRAANSNRTSRPRPDVSQRSRAGRNPGVRRWRLERFQNTRVFSGVQLSQNAALRSGVDEWRSRLRVGARAHHVDDGVSLRDRQARARRPLDLREFRDREGRAGVGQETLCPRRTPAADGAPVAAALGSRRLDYWDAASSPRDGAGYRDRSARAALDGAEGGRGGGYDFSTG